MEKFIYETPQTEVVEIFAEGVLCESTQNGGGGFGDLVEGGDIN